MDHDLPTTELPEYLQGLEWPAAKEDVIAHSAEYGAPNEVLDYLEGLPSAAFRSEASLWQAISDLEDAGLTELLAFDEESEDEISS